MTNPGGIRTDITKKDDGAVSYADVFASQPFRNQLVTLTLTGAQIKAALGDLDKVVRVVRLGGFINSAPDFVDGPKVLNGASDLMVQVFGDKGRHARTTIGVAAPRVRRSKAGYWRWRRQRPQTQQIWRIA